MYIDFLPQKLYNDYYAIIALLHPRSNKFSLRELGFAEIHAALTAVDIVIEYFSKAIINTETMSKGVLR